MRHSLIFAALGAMAIGQVSMAEPTYQPWEDAGAAKRPYIFTQQHNAQSPDGANRWKQLIRLGYPIQVQLPGNPALWSFQPDASRNVTYLGRTMVYSPDRIAGTSSVFVFDLALAPNAIDGTEGYFTFTTDELPPSLDNVVPDGVFTVYFSVIDPR